MKKTDRPGHDKAKGYEALENKTHSDREKIESADIKNAHASGTGSLERSDENQIEKLNNGSLENDKTGY